MPAVSGMQPGVGTRDAHGKEEDEGKETNRQNQSKSGEKARCTRRPTRNLSVTGSCVLSVEKAPINTRESAEDPTTAVKGTVPRSVCGQVGKRDAVRLTYPTLSGAGVCSERETGLPDC